MDSPTVDTGFGVVAQNILTRLAQKEHEIHCLAINYFGDNPSDARRFQNIYLYPVDKGNIDNLYGYNKFWSLEDAIKPDLIFWLNDPWIIEKYMALKPKTHDRYYKSIVYFPLDAGPLKPNWAKVLSDMDAQVCYSHFAERIIQEANGGKRPNNLHQIYHGVDTSKFFPINQGQARETLGLPQDAFIVGMVARNQYRKRFDILAKAFAKFAEDKPNAKLYLHTGLHDVGFDIIDMSRQLNLGKHLILTEGMEVTRPLPIDKLNLVYNTFDVNALISLGDGFGLPVAESMATGCPQLVNDHSCLKELVEGHGGLTVRTAAWLLNTSGINTWGGVADVDDLVAKLQILYDNKELRLRLAQDGYSYITQEIFQWDSIAEEFNSIIGGLFHLIKGGKSSDSSKKHIGTASAVPVGF
jgi:glycosyltransferase involved in cell wall biosynthesis